MQDRFVIAIGRQLGSGGRAVGEAIARRLGIRLYDRQLISLAAEESGLGSEFFEKADEKEARRTLSTLIGYLRSPFMGDAGNLGILLRHSFHRIDHQHHYIRPLNGGNSPDNTIFF